MHSRLLRITIKNLLSFKDIAMELGGLNVLVGENASGKSNFLKALRLLKLLSHGSSLGDAVKSLGFSSERDVIFSQEENLEALLLLEADIDGVQYEYELRFKPGRIISELLKAEGLRLIERRDASGEYLSLDERMISISYPVPPSWAFLGDVAKRSDVSERIRAFHHFVESWGFYSF
jgi:predicted ATPase